MLDNVAVPTGTAPSVTAMIPLAGRPVGFNTVTVIVRSSRYRGAADDTVRLVTEAAFSTVWAAVDVLLR